MNYTELKEKHSKEFGEFPIAFAFSDKQLDEALAKLGATKDEVCVTGRNGIVKKTDAQAYVDLLKRLDKELEDAMKDDAFLTEAIRYELGNHEYGYTRDPTDTIECLGLSMDDERTLRCFNAAKKEYLAWDELHNN